MHTGLPAWSRLTAHFSRSGRDGKPLRGDQLRFTVKPLAQAHVCQAASHTIKHTAYDLTMAS